MPDPAPSTSATDPADVSDHSTPPPPHDDAPPAPAAQSVEQQATPAPPEPAAAPAADQVAAPAAVNERAPDAEAAPAAVNGPAPAAASEAAPTAAPEAAPASGAGALSAPPAPIPTPADASTSAPADASTPAPAPADAPAGNSTPATAPDDTSAPAPASPPPPVGGDVGAGDDHGGGDGEDPQSEQDEPGGRRDRKKVQIDARVLLALLVVAALAAGAYAFGTYQGNQAKAPGTTGTTVFQPPKEFATLTDPETGVKLSVPQNWAQYSTKELKDKAIRLIVGIPNTGDTVVVRVNSYSTEITEANLADQKNVFDQLLGAEDIEVFVNEMTKLNGMPALFYVYRFTDAATGTTGIHAHYFVFQGRKMVSLIFQALPEPRYQTLASTFDRIANSLEVAPGPPPAFLEPVITTTVPPGATPAPSAPAPAPAPAPGPPTTG